MTSEGTGKVHIHVISSQYGHFKYSHLLVYCTIGYSHRFFVSSADPLSNIGGMLVFNSKEEAVAFAVKNGTYVCLQTLEHNLYACKFRVVIHCG